MSGGTDGAKAPIADAPDGSTASVEGMMQMWTEAAKSCSRMFYGRCMTIACLKRAGYSLHTREQYSYEEWIQRATCIEREFLRLSGGPTGSPDRGVAPGISATKEKDNG